MSATTTTTTPPQHVSFHTPTDTLRQSTLKKSMSITQTYYLAHKARAKLSREAAQADHDLRLLVGHANLLDTLMVELADAEREQERWFNQSVRTADHKQERQVQWDNNQHLSEVAEEEEDEVDDTDSESESDYDSDDEFYEESATAAFTTLRPKSTIKAVEAEDDEMMEDNLEEDYAQLELVRTPSHTNSAPPGLVDETGETDESEDESMPPSPATPTATLASMPDAINQETREEYDDYLSQDTKQSTTATTMVTAIPVC
ncbi:hypothetical protein GMORB2_2249 [Geosmithia morbida]|uniref:Uncharacterized protein n=1 Tax=Geosmithia morbida TaxID=1094350 RepID=A0A9P4YRM6_9HYPO|nr:uncharacterized protein GMORB2_2249 [Geosmithia morbida]KAF4121287.1 hypothetical protein GMORB2_2249 [Geosmithia morbida]